MRSPNGRATGGTGLPLVALGLLVAALLAGCRTEYRNPDADIDGVLWRQVASVEDPFNSAVLDARTPNAPEFFAGLPAKLWERPDGPLPDLDDPVAIVYDIDTAGDSAAFSVYFSSGTRRDAPADDGTRYRGPDSVFSCARWTVQFAPDAVGHADRGDLGNAWEDCPAELVAGMPGTTAFAEPGVFDG